MVVAHHHGDHVVSFDGLPQPQRVLFRPLGQFIAPGAQRPSVEAVVLEDDDRASAVAHVFRQRLLQELQAFFRRISIRLAFSVVVAVPGIALIAVEPGVFVELHEMDALVVQGIMQPVLGEACQVGAVRVAGDDRPSLRSSLRYR